MAGPGELWRRLLFLFRRSQFDRDLEEEMRFHMEMSGRRRFGSLVLAQEDSRAAWGWMWAERLGQDARYAFRGMRKSPGFTAAVILTLALGIGVNTAIFGLVDRLMLRPLPFPQSDRLATLYFRNNWYPYAYKSLSYPDYVYYRDHNEIFSGLVAYDDVTVNLRAGDDDEAVAAEIVSANYFDVLGVRPVLGRSFLPEEDAAPGRNPVAMLSREMWERRFAADPGILGHQIAVNGAQFTIVGIVPSGFTGLDLDRKSKPEIWFPTMMYPVILWWGADVDLQHHGGDEWLAATGRLKPGVTMSQANAHFAQLTERLKPIWRATKVSNGKDIGLLAPANESRFRPEERRTVTTFLTMLMAVVGLVLLIACANTASLLLARAVKRRHEIGVRVALGAGRRRLAQQLITEGMLLALAGGAAGLGVAALIQRVLAGIERPLHFELLLDQGLDGRILAFAFALSAATGIIFGCLPLREAARLNAAPLLRSRAFGARNILVVVQVAVSLVLLAGAGLFVRTLRNAQAADITRDPDRVLLLPLTLAKSRYDDARGQVFFETLLERLHSVPGVRSAAYVMVVPFGGRRGGTDIVPYPGAKPVQVDFNVISAEYFTTIGIPLIRGRLFNPRDRAGVPAVAIVNEQMARSFWPGQDPIGKQIQLEGPKRMAEIVGVVRDGKFRGYREPVNPCFYIPLVQTRMRNTNLEVRAATDAAAIAPAVRHEIRALDKNLSIPEAQTLRAFRDASLGQERLSAALLSGLGALAMIIAGIGLYGVLAFAVAQRTREIGVRMALGAAAGQVLRGVLREAAVLIGGGLAIGSAAAALLGRLVANLLYGVSATDPWIYTVGSGMLLAVGMTAAFLPARRASHVDPIQALRYE
jgi:putative ABC transport system permease protein